MTTKSIIIAYILALSMLVFVGLVFYGIYESVKPLFTPPPEHHYMYGDEVKGLVKVECNTKDCADPSLPIISSLSWKVGTGVTTDSLDCQFYNLEGKSMETCEIIKNKGRQ